MKLFLIALFFLFYQTGIVFSESYKFLEGKFLYVEISKNTSKGMPFINNWVKIFNSREECHNYIIYRMLDNEQLHRFTGQNPDGTKFIMIYSAYDKKEHHMHFFRQCIDINISNK